MKIIYQSDRPKSRQRKFSPSGICFSYNWEQIEKIVQEHRLSCGLTEHIEPVKLVYVDDNEVTFFTDTLGSLK